jgi:hypothetical protein
MDSQVGPSGHAHGGGATPRPPLPPTTIAFLPAVIDWRAEPGAASRQDGISADQEAAWRALYCVVIHSAAVHLRM